jgi:type IV pilus assembly protein PilM
LGFRKPKKAIGLDIGTHSVKAVLVSGAKGRLRVERVCSAPVDRNQLSADPVLAQSLATLEAMQDMPKAQSLTVAALSGQAVVVRYLRLTDVPREQLASTIAKEAANNIPYNLNEVYMDWTVLGEYQEEGRKITRVLIVAAMREVLDMRLQVLRNADIECGILSVDSLALADAGEACQFILPDETVAIIDIGLTSSSVQFIKAGVSNFIRDVNWGSRELIQTIAKTQKCSYEQAVSLIESYQKDTSQFPDALETDLRIPGDSDDRLDESTISRQKEVFSPLEPLEDEDDYLSNYNKKDVRRTDLPMAMEHRNVVGLGEIISAPLGRLAVELRKSFDYYEHQLYEQPVDRVLLCGGLAEFLPLTQALEEELGFGVIEIAFPSTNALHITDRRGASALLEHPSQFIVALGLAARGMADL